MTIAAQNLSFYYQKGQPILEDISFAIPQHDFVGIFGPNGGGKTTLLKLLLGLEKPSKGTVALCGKPPQEASKEVGYVPQIRHFDPQFPITVKEVVLQGCFAHYRGYGPFSKEAQTRALEALEQVGLTSLAHRSFSTLSGGQIQRTLIARALATQPKILLLDEATVGIDPDALQEFFLLLKTLRKKMTILLVTHDLQMIAKEMDRLLCIQRTLTVYTPDQVCGHFAMGLYHPPLLKEKKNHGPL